MNRRHVLFAVSSICLVACDSASDLGAAEASVAQFHALLDAGQFELIYAGSGDDMKQSITQEAFIELLRAIRNKLGNVKTTERLGSNTSYAISGTFVTLIYKTTFADGEGTEQFVFRSTEPKPVLAGYHMNSPAMIVR